MREIDNRKRGKLWVIFTVELLVISASRNLFPLGEKGVEMKRGEELLIVVSGRASVSLYKPKEIAVKLRLVSEAREIHNRIEQKYPLMARLPIFAAW